MLSVLVLGACGYLGHACVRRLREEMPGVSVTALIYSVEHSKVLQASGVTVRLGNKGNLGEVVELSSKADMVINAAQDDSIPLVQAITAGQRIHSEGGRRSILIHFSNIVHSLHAEQLGSLRLQTTRFSDDSLDWLFTPTVNNPSRLVDFEIMDIASDSPISVVIIAPAMIFGSVANTAVRQTHPLANLIDCAMSRRYMLFPGDGRNMGNAIHINDLLNLLMSVIRSTLSQTASQTEQTQFFFASSSEFCWCKVAERIASILYERGLLDSARVYTASAREYPSLSKYKNNYSIESRRAEAFGWTPLRNSATPSFEASLESEVDHVLADVMFQDAK